MELKKIIATKEKKLSKLIEQNVSINFSKVQKLIREKNVKVNGKRTGEDVLVHSGDMVEVYLPETKVNIFYEDNDIIVAFKPRKIETINETGDSLLDVLEKQKGEKLFAVHRLDRNTEGLVVFAKNIEAKNSLDEAFKNRTIHKYYLALVAGVPATKQDNLIAYLKKDEANSLVSVSDKKEQGYEEIKTNYTVIKENENSSVLEVELLTGKTHQIRAHLAHIGYPIIGDEKYGNTKINKAFSKRFQCLCAYKLVFDFEPQNYLAHLNSKIIEIDKNNIDFFKN
jgi:23S rRNA pseudouridine955/2504/2580 synthase